MNIYVLFGQTATGKTARALELAKQYNGELVNFDSRQIYKKLNIVTGKDIPISSKLKAQSSKIQSKYDITYFELPDFSFQPSTRIWLYDIVDPKTSFSSAEYVDCAKKTIQDILSRGKTPILVGGTGYYLLHLLYGVPETNVKENWTLRNMLNKKSVEELQTILKEKKRDVFESMNNSDRNNPRRLIRRIEICEGGETIERQTQRIQFKETLHFLPFFHPTSEMVKEKIADRVEARIKEGAIEEVKKLLDEGYTKQDPGLNAIGYTQLISYIKGERTLLEIKKEWITKEVQYAKRQKTYFKKYFSTV